MEVEIEDESLPPEGVNLKETSMLKYIIPPLGNLRPNER